MNDTSRHAPPDNDSVDGDLDAALRAAFAPSLGAGDTRSGVFARLDTTLGASSRVLLRDGPDDRTPVVRVPAQAEASRHRPSAKYQVLGELARGGVGVVMKTRDTDLGRDIAMKVLRRDHTDNPNMVRRFVEEAQIAGQLQHPGILPVYEMGMRDDQTPYFTMKLVKGRTLAALLNERKDAARDQVRFVTIFEQICQTLAYAHAKGVIHRDLKPSNIMVGAFGEVQLVDWGLAKVLAQGGIADERPADQPRDDESMIETVRTASPESHSLVGSVMGTPAYMSPEQARGEVDRLDERSDVFALGAILCEILTGEPPFTGDRGRLLQQARSCDLSGANQRLSVSAVDEDLTSLVRRCLAASPTDRPRDAGEVAEEIAAHHARLEDRARASELAAARSDTKAREERRARRLTVALASVVLFTFLLAGAGWLWIQRDSIEQANRRADQLNGALDRAAELLGQATAAPVGKKQPWSAVGAAGSQVEAILEQGELDEDTARRAEMFLGRLSQAQRDRSIIERIEEGVIFGATHQDRDSWEWMERELRGAFADYGIDLSVLMPAEVAARMRESDMADQLADGLELWIGTRAHLLSFGGTEYTFEDLMPWVEALYEADPEPFVSNVRRLMYSAQPTVEQVQALADSVDFAEARPRTLSWLASACYRTGDIDMVQDIFTRAVLVHPDDFMLNFDYAYLLVPTKKWQKAIRYYHRCLAIRPGSGGVWRSLGVALRETAELDASADALRQSIILQPDHGPTFLDLGLTLEEQGKTNGAIEAYEKAIVLKPNFPAAMEHLQNLRSGSKEQDSEAGAGPTEPRP